MMRPRLFPYDPTVYLLVYSEIPSRGNTLSSVKLANFPGVLYPRSCENGDGGGWELIPRWHNCSSLQNCWTAWPIQTRYSEVRLTVLSNGWLILTDTPPVSPVMHLMQVSSEIHVACKCMCCPKVSYSGRRFLYHYCYCSITLTRCWVTIECLIREGCVASLQLEDSICGFFAIWTFFFSFFQWAPNPKRVGGHHLNLMSKCFKRY